MNAVNENVPIDHGGPVARPFEPFPHSALNGSLSERFEFISGRFGDRLALSDTAQSLTYSELAASVDRVAAAIVGATAGREGPVAILVNNDVGFPIALLGVWAANRSCIPLDQNFPLPRSQLIATQAGAAAVLSVGELAARVRGLFPGDLPVLDLDALDDATQGGPKGRPGAMDVACILYTSGSTGIPKGVCLTHCGLVDGALRLTNALHINCDDQLTMCYSPSVIAGIRDILGALLNGAAVHILPPRELTPSGVVREIRSRGITVFHSVPALFRRLAEALGSDERLNGLRIVNLAGDRVDWSDVETFRKACSDNAFLYVGLGSTESSALYCAWFVDERLRSTGPLPTGRVLPDRTWTLVNDEGKPVADGEIGEFVLGSRYFARGYWRAPELTAQIFSADPSDPEIQVIKTGDMARRRPDGLFEFAGRKDEQVKLHGFRIEPVEIETALRGCPGVRDAAVVMRKNENGSLRSLVAYAELQPDVRGLLPRHLTAMLAQQLPPHMVPSLINIIDEFPRLPNFKIDRPQLGQIDAVWAKSTSERINDPLIDEVAQIFESVLGTLGATPDDNVDSLGGDSLQSMNVALELGKRFEIDISPETFDPSQTIRGWARWIASQTAPSPARIED